MQSTSHAAGQSHVRFERRDDVALIQLERPPLNSLDYAMQADLLSAIDCANADQQVRAIVITGGSSAFCAHADLEDESELSLARTLTSAIEDSAKPVVAAIAGLCSGVGLEVALAAHYRVALKSAQLSLPQINQGLLPYAGGSQRLPRLIGPEAALNLMLEGAPAAAHNFEGEALFDRLVDADVLEVALSLAQSAAGQAVPRVRNRVASDPQLEAFAQFCRRTVAARKNSGPAAMQGVELVVASVTKSFDDGMEQERETHAALFASPHARALRYINRAQGRAAAFTPQSAASRPRLVRSVGVIGAGTMGRGIAMTFANAGLPVVMVETNQSALDNGVQEIERGYASSLSRGRLTQCEIDSRMALISPTLSYEALADADLIIEAVFEQLDVKEQVLRRIDRIARPGAILASNTSALNFDTLAEFTRRPQDMIGMHFFSPAHVMRLLEVVRGRKTADDVLLTVMELAQRIGKIPVIARVSDGFIGNRMLARYVAAADRLVREGAAPEQVDAALEKFGFAMGPFRMGDLAGLDIALAGRRRRAAEHPEHDYTMVADALCEAGRFGQKTAAGWYRYEPGGRRALPDPEVAQIVADWRRNRGIQPRQVDAAEIVERCLLALINEGARVIEEGIAQRASDIDVVYVNGYGFPAHRGGPMYYGQQLGLIRVVRLLKRISAQQGSDPSWKPAPLLLRLAAENRPFS
jgi:3-hydroxyacyl-CoA dehydrogenase